MLVVEASPVAVVPPRLKVDGVLVAGAVAVVLEPGSLKALPLRVLGGAGDGVEISVGLGARPGNRLPPMAPCQTTFCLGSSEYVTCSGHTCRGPCRCRRRAKDWGSSVLTTSLYLNSVLTGVSRGLGGAIGWFDTRERASTEGICAGGGRWHGAAGCTGIRCPTCRIRCTGK